MIARYTERTIHANAPFIGTCAERLSRHRGTRVMALVNYRRRAGNLIDRDKRSNCWQGGARTYSRYIYFFFRVARYEINPWHTALRVLAPLSASTWGDDKKHDRKLVFF